MVTAALVCLLAATAMAGDIRMRMKERAPAIEILRIKGIVGENWAGFIEFRGTPQQEDLVRAENSDRKTVYTEIAKQNGMTIEEIGKKRARVIAQKAKPGVWLQQPTGKWYQK